MESVFLELQTTTTSSFPMLSLLPVRLRSSQYIMRPVITNVTVPQIRPKALSSFGVRFEIPVT